MCKQFAVNVYFLIWKHRLMLPQFSLFTHQGRSALLTSMHRQCKRLAGQVTTGYLCYLGKGESHAYVSSLSITFNCFHIRWFHTNKFCTNSRISKNNANQSTTSGIIIVTTSKSPSGRKVVLQSIDHKSSKCCIHLRMHLWHSKDFGNFT